MSNMDSTITQLIGPEDVTAYSAMKSTLSVENEVV